MKTFKKFIEKLEEAQHFSSKEKPGQADDTFHSCIEKVKAEAKRDGKEMSEKEAAAICEKSREEGGATLKFGEKRKEDRRS